MTDRERILAGDYQLLDSLIQNRNDWKLRAEKLERLVDRIVANVDILNDSPLSLLAGMQEFSKNWKTDRTNYLG